MIKRFHVQNYKALRDLTLDLSPLHLLIGPNDSGKTSILEAIAALCRSVDKPLANAFTGAWKGVELVWNGDRQLPVSLEAQVEDKKIGSFRYDLSCRFTPTERSVLMQNETVMDIQDAESASIEFPSKNHSLSGVMQIAMQGRSADDAQRGWALRIHDALTGIQYYRWSPRFLALPVAPSSDRQAPMESSGFGLALCLDDILGDSRDRFAKLENRFKKIFPQIESIKLKYEPAFKSPTNDSEDIPLLQRAEGKGIYFQLSGADQLIPASQASDGTLLVLAYLAILYLPKPPRLVLVEEPENGIHPKRLEDLLSIIRDLVKEQNYSQVIMTTHSPYVLDLFEPEEVTLCQRKQDGSTTARRLSESAKILEQSGLFTLGEIWTAEGDAALAKPNNSNVEPNE
jgi:predicted ATPase